MSWMITEAGPYDQAAIDRLGNKFLVGNGYLGYRGTLEEYTKDQKTATIVSGLYDQVGDKWREPVNLPNGGYVQVFVDGKPLDVLSSKVQAHSQSLDIAHGVHLRRTVFQTGDGKLLLVLARRFASLASPHLLCLEFTVQALEECEIVICTGIDGDVWDLNGPHLEAMASSTGEGVISLSARTHENGIPVAVSECTLLPGAQETILDEENRVLREFRVALDRHQPCTFSKFIAVHTGIDSQNPLEESLKLCRQAAQAGFEQAYREHCALWDERWQSCDVQIQGDEAAQQALRFSMYHLLAIAPTHTDTVSIPARGLSGQVYKGAIFWDTEIFMLPFLSHAFPAIARNLLLYRYHTLDGARRKAAEYGCRGAFYAWESQDTGGDACTLFNITDVFTNRPMRTYFRDKQVHISADVVYAAWQYYTLTGDSSIFLDGIAEVIYECARFFLSYLYYSPEKKRYEILDVTGPDEYHERVHNNAFTNLMAAHTFEGCLKVNEYLQEHHPEQAAALLERLDFATDLEAIREAANALYILQPDAHTSVIPQFDGYFNLEDLGLSELLNRKLHPHEYLGGGSGLATTTQIIKQADVVLALFLFGERYSSDVKAANWEFYEPRTEHGSSLSACSYSLIAAEIGKIEWAYSYFMKTATIDLTGESKQYVGTLYIGGTHPAANGGAWMAAVMGLCGVRCLQDAIAINPRLPDHWNEVRLPLTYHGQKLAIQLTKDILTVQAVQPLAQEIRIKVSGVVYSLPRSEPLLIPLPNESTQEH
jgi:trehalose/maltose hydrolase-like predicted phosphorylase